VQPFSARGPHPQAFVKIPTAKLVDFRPVTPRVVRSKPQPSGLEVLVLLPPKPVETEAGVGK